MRTDPYGLLELCIGDGDDFWCFDFGKDGDNIVIHAVINSETGGFIENAEPIATVPADKAVDYAKNLTELALDWCAENDVKHDVEGWSQDCSFFWRSVEGLVNGNPDVQRIINYGDIA